MAPADEVQASGPPGTVTEEPSSQGSEPEAGDETAAPPPSERKPYSPGVPAPKKPQKPRTTASKIAEIPILIVVAFVIAVLIKTFLVQAFYIPSGSMIPTLHRGDRVLVEKLSYRFGEPQRGQVVVFARDVFGGEQPDLPWLDDARIFVRDLLGLPTGREEDYIKRIVAVGGDTIRYTGSPRKLFVNGEAVPQDFVNGGEDTGSPTITSSDCARLDMEPVERGCRVPSGTVFVMGDNRGNSEDSRVIGPVDQDKIVGKAMLIIWPPNDWSTL
jgi:signal peptidase I